MWHFILQHLRIQCVPLDVQLIVDLLFSRNIAHPLFKVLKNQSISNIQHDTFKKHLSNPDEELTIYLVMVYMYIYSTSGHDF